MLEITSNTYGILADAKKSEDSDWCRYCHDGHYDMGTHGDEMIHSVLSVGVLSIVIMTVSFIVFIASVLYCSYRNTILVLTAVQSIEYEE